eukprot:TRINITY_DN3528_c0_g2_i1.p2 TRINITY_DN3528_c0_g2~~TRINITY_DN3528_c0_g2_i1.p2  ORF type:complete len:220 (-),score=56.71 TRINITY_DN3528_c0_g2_i1:1205-1864(-)
MKNLFSLPRAIYNLHARAPKNRHEGLAVNLANLATNSSTSRANIRNGQGNGCGAGCGCVCDISLSVTPQGVVSEAGYVSKRLVLGGGTAPLRTARGHLLVTECTCSVVNGLSSLLTSQFKGRSLEYLRNAVLYVPRAPDAAVRSLARNLELAPHQTACLQVVESAVIAALDDRHAPPASDVALAVGVSSGVRRAGEAAAPTEEEEVLCEVDFRDQYDYV